MFDPHGHAIRLTDEQRAVVDHGPGPALVVSGAGSGKTTVLLMRVRRLIQDGVDPRNICMVTFARRGAADMRRRAALLGVPTGVEYRTLHSMSWKVIMEAAQTRQPEVPKKWQIVKTVKKELEVIKDRMRGSARRNMPKPREVLQEIGLAKANMIWPDETDYASGEVIRPGVWYSPVLGREVPSYAEWAETRSREPIGPKLARIVGRCYGVLESTSRCPEAFGFERDAGLRWVTYDDMVALVARGILTGAHWVRDWYATRPVMMIDEVQDNSPVNWVTCEYFAGPDRHIMVVGDDMQAVFCWRGSDPMLMQEFQARHPDTVVYHLTTNFRSGSAMLEPMNRVVECAPSTLNTGLRCGTGREGLSVVTKFENAAQEAREVVQDICAEIAAGSDLDEIAVLYRINASSGPVEMQLIESGVPYRVAGSSFFRRGEIKAAIGYLGCALDPQDDVGWRGCANAPTRYLGGKFFESYPTAEKAFEGLASGDLGRWSRGVRAAKRAVERVRVLLVERKSLRMTLMYVFDEAGVRKHFKDDGAAADDETDVDEACDALVSCAGSLTSGIHHRRLAEEALAEEDVEPELDESSAEEAAAALVRFAREMTETGIEDFAGERGAVPRVTLSTIHKAKGLEWGRVYVIGNNPGLFPLPNAPKAEERRLFYVAGTRAKYVSHFSYVDLSAMEQVVAPSPFLVEAGLVELPPDESEDAATDDAVEAEDEAEKPEAPVEVGSQEGLDPMFVF